MPTRGRIHARIKDPRIDAEIQHIYDNLQNLKIDGAQLNAASVSAVVGKAIKDGQLEVLNRFLNGEYIGNRIQLNNKIDTGSTLRVIRESLLGAAGFPAGFFSLDVADVETVRIENQAKGPALYLENKGAGGTANDATDAILVMNNPGTGDSIHVTAGATTARLTAVGIWTDHSSVASKENFTEIPEGVMIGKIKKLPVYEFSFKGHPHRKHFGPTSEDFYEQFRLGDDSGISGRDLAAISLAGVKCLIEKVESLEKKVKELEAKK